MDKVTLERKLKFIKDYTAASNAATGSKYDANANITSKNLATLTCELSKKDLIDINRSLMSSYIEKLYDKELADMYYDDINNHIIYRNDESSVFPYCASISLYPYLLNGLKDLGGSSAVPKHANSFIGGLINLIFLVASQFAGAIAIPEFITYFDHFLRLDYGQDYIHHLDDVVEKVGEHKFTLKHKIEDWFQQFVYSINQPAGARNYQSPFTNIAYFDMYYFKNIFKDFIFPDGDEPCWETTKELQKIFIKWFNKERTHAILTFPVETFNILVENKRYKDTETADFIAESWSEGHSFFCYQSDSVDALASCCRLRNAIEDNVFSYTLGAGGIETGSKCVITLNLNRIVQNWKKEDSKLSLSAYITPIINRVHKYLAAWDSKLRDDLDNDMLPVYKAGFIDLDKQFLTVGINGFLEAAEFLNIPIDFRSVEYIQLAQDILGTIEYLNKENRTKYCKYNLECIPAENLGAKNYNWDKKDGYKVNKNRNCYNSYFYPVEDPSIDPISKFFYQGYGFADICSGGVALHNNLDSHLSKEQYRKLMDIAIIAGCNYFTFNIPNLYCPKCGHIDKRYLDHCPECGNTEVDYATRVIGYLKLISNFSEARQIEAKQRYYGNI